MPPAPPVMRATLPASEKRRSGAKCSNIAQVSPDQNDEIRWAQRRKRPGSQPVKDVRAVPPTLRVRRGMILPVGASRWRGVAVRIARSIVPELRIRSEPLVGHLPRAVPYWAASDGGRPMSRRQKDPLRPLSDAERRALARLSR